MNVLKLIYMVHDGPQMVYTWFPIVLTCVLMVPDSHHMVSDGPNMVPDGFHMVPYCPHMVTDCPHMMRQ